mgnify:FL=1
MQKSLVDHFAALPMRRDREAFLLELIRGLTGTLEDVIGREDSEGFISVVGARIGEAMSRDYAEALETTELSTEQLAAVLVDLKRRIEGGFSIESISTDEIVLVNSRCPFGDYVKGRESLCMMTSNVFGRISANNSGYAYVRIDEAIARGDGRCRVVVSLKPGMARQSASGREYFGRDK